jgi:hypothetical protein
VQTLDESKRTARQEGAVTPSHVPPSGDNGGKESPGGASPRDSVQALPAEPSSSPGVSIGNFDILASLKEAEIFALEVKRFADLIPDPRWQAISRGMDYAIQVHDKLNQARANA